MPTVRSSRVFIDTNILYYLNDKKGPFFAQSAARIDELIDDENDLFISSQVLREYAHVTLRNAVYHKLDLAESIRDVLFNISSFQNDYEMLYDGEPIFSEWLSLLPKLTTGRDVFDFNLAATMRANGIQHLLTHNVSDFNKFSDWLVVLPLFP